MEAHHSLVSVLMPVHNAEATLAGSVASVRAQGYGAWELLIVDDGSTDGSGDLARGLAAQDARIRVLALPRNSGAAAARNHALYQARGRYIAFLDADDMWHPDKLARQLTFMAVRGAALSFTAYDRMAENGARIEQVRVADHVPYDMLLRRNVMGCLTVIYDAELLGKVAMPLLTRQQDYALWLRLARAAGGAHGLDEVLAIYRVGRGTLSANKAGAAGDIWRLYRREEGLGLIASAWYFTHYAWYGLGHRLFQRPAKDAPMLDLSFGDQGRNAAPK